MEEYGQLDTACREWRFKTTALKTWEVCVKHFTNHIKYLDTWENSESQGYHGANSIKKDSTLDDATSVLRYTQFQMANLAPQSNDHHNSMLEIKLSLVAANANLQTLRVTKKINNCSNTTPTLTLPPTPPTIATHTATISNTLASASQHPDQSMKTGPLGRITMAASPKTMTPEL